MAGLVGRDQGAPRGPVEAVLDAVGVQQGAQVVLGFGAESRAG
jgi:hypothetical protein